MEFVNLYFRGILKHKKFFAGVGLGVLVGNPFDAYQLFQLVMAFFV